MVIITEEKATPTTTTMATMVILHQLTITIPIKVKVDTVKVDTIKEDITNAAKEEEAMASITINIDEKEVISTNEEEAMITMGMVKVVMATIEETIATILPIVVLVVEPVQPVQPFCAAFVIDYLQLLLQCITSDIDKYA